MRLFLLLGIYVLFFLSGAAALIYQIVWVRQLTLIFGGSHLAVTAVLSIFMAGLALGGYGIGKYVDRLKKPLRLYGLLELGIAASAVLFAGLIDLYPSIYIPLAEGKDGSPLYLSIVRVLFSFAALIVPTTLMGGTLPVLSAVAARRPKDIGSHVAFLYGFNTLGAVAGALVAGFFLLRLYTVSTTLYVAVAINIIVGVASLLFQKRSAAVFPASENDQKRKVPEAASAEKPDADPFPLKLVLWGIGVSGFCALGYEVLWTRILAIVIGANVYSFTIMLVAFLVGIALGSQAYGLFPRLTGSGENDGIKRTVLRFGAVQIVIGATALAVTFWMANLPGNSLRLREYFMWFNLNTQSARLGSSFALAFLYMVVPAFFMGLAFPLAGRVHASYKKSVGSAVGEVLAFNTIGAILGAAISGYALIYLFGIERSLQMLTVVNIGFGIFILVRAGNKKNHAWLAASATVGCLMFLAFNQTALRIWDTHYFAIFRTNQPAAFATPEKIREAIENTDVLYYAEGADAIVSSIRIKGGDQAFLTNGRVEASSRLEGQLCQYTLGHLPLLLHKNPKDVLVVGTGSGMTLGATSVHPSVETITLAEIEPKVIGVARSFQEYNHKVLDNPKLKIVFNDGRNFLLTTKDRFDVVTADPIHPWFRGAGYLYTTEYFKLVSSRLRPGGVVCQWLPIYEMTVKDLKSVARTFSEVFPHTMMWLTHNDAELIGSMTPIVIDEAELERRISNPEISADLKRVMMGSAREFLSYFVMGSEQMRAFSKGGVLNTDDNLYLEFSAPFSITMPVIAEDLGEIYRHRGSILPYLAVSEKDIGVQQASYWRSSAEAGELTGLAHLLYTSGNAASYQMERLISELEQRYPWYAPGRFLKNEYLSDMAKIPVLVQTIALPFRSERGGERIVEISMVKTRISDEMAILDIVDKNARTILGQVRVPGGRQDEFIRQFVDKLAKSIDAAYREEAGNASLRRELPRVEQAMRRIQNIIAAAAKAEQGT